MKKHAEELPPSPQSRSWNQLKEHLEELLGWKPGSASTLSPEMLLEVVRGSLKEEVRALAPEMQALIDNRVRPIWL